jgi:uncharacterized tellurite resistance protein B-like protein
MMWSSDERTNLMANPALIPALAKALVAIAWADGEIHREEETTLKEVLGLLPPMSAKEWAAIELYLVYPTAPSERDELVAQAVSQIRGADDKATALEAVDAMIHADGVAHPEEVEVAQEIRAAFAAVNVSVFASVGRTIGAMIQRWSGREVDIELWRTNPVLYYLQAQPATLDDAERPEVAVAALAAGIMAQVVRISPTDAARERPVLAAALAHDWRVTEQQADQITAAAIAVTRRDIDYHRLSRELVARTQEAERVRLLDTLFAITNTVDRVSQEELDLVRVIANRLNLTQQQFIAAKLKIAPEDRRGR